MFGTKSSDPLTRVGSTARLIGVIMVVAPVASALLRGFLMPPEPNPLLDPLPRYNPTSIAYRHPAWVAAVSAPIGVCLVAVSSQFLRRRFSALEAIRRYCWVGVGVLVLLGVLSAISLRSMTGQELFFFTIVGVLMYFGFAIILAKLARQLSTSEWQERFERGRD